MNFSKPTGKIGRLNWIKLIFFLSIILSFIFFLIVINNMFLSVVLAFVLSQLARPIVDWMEGSFGLSRLTATFTVFSSIIILLGVFITLTLPFFSDQIRNLQNEIPRYITKAIALSDEVVAKIQSLTPFELDNKLISEEVRTYSFSSISNFAKNLPETLGSIFSVIFLSFFMSFFMVKDSYTIMKGFFILVPNHIFTTVMTLTHKISQQISKFIQVRILEAFIVGVITCAGLQIISFPFAVLLGLFAGVMNLVPYLGPIIGALPTLLIAFINDYTLVGFLTVLSVYVIAQIIDNLVLIPILVARMMKLHPVTVLLLVAIGAQFLGILGMIISIPFAIVIQVTYRAVYEHIIIAESIS